MGRHFAPPDILRQLRRRRGVAAILVGLIALAGWGVAGARVISVLNPSLGHELAVADRPALDVWIAPPDYAQNTAPMIISTPAGVRFEHDTLVIPQGSTISAHLAEQDGDAPELVVDGTGEAFTTDAHGDFAATETLTTGKKLSIRRGWMTLASWKIKVVADDPPKVTMTDPPSITEGKTVRISYSASDELDVTEVALRITPNDPLPGANNTPVEIPLPVAAAKEISRVDFEDLTSRPWAGQKVSLQIVATNETGKRAMTAPVDFTLPERSFFHPISRVLIEERKKLLQHPESEAQRDEAANIMASIAHEAANYHGDPVILMALRSGAVRLILERSTEAAISVNDLLWQAATRIEDGSTTATQRALRDARQDLANAIDRNAGWQEIQTLTERLQQAMNAYLLYITTHHHAAKHADKDAAVETARIERHLSKLSAVSAGNPTHEELLKLREDLESFGER